MVERNIMGETDKEIVDLCRKIYRENKEAIEKSKLIHEKTKASYPFLMPDKTNFNGRLNGIQNIRLVII